jgi:hypothetical protein
MLLEAVRDLLGEIGVDEVHLQDLSLDRFSSKLARQRLMTTF